MIFLCVVMWAHLLSPSGQKVLEDRAKSSLSLRFPLYDTSSEKYTGYSRQQIWPGGFSLLGQGWEEGGSFWQRTWARVFPPSVKTARIYTINITREDIFGRHTGICGGSVHPQMLAGLQGSLLVNGSELDLQGPSWVWNVLSC